MNPWFAPYSWLYKSPLSGDVTQDISPFTNLFSPQIELNFAGNRKIEQKVITEVASYGKQLGILTEALLELAGDNTSPEVERLKELNEEIAKVKEQTTDELENSAKEALDCLKEADPKALQRILDSYST